MLIKRSTVTYGRVEVELHLFLTSTMVGRRGGGGWEELHYTIRSAAREGTRCLLNRRLRGLHSLFGRFGKEKNLSPVPGVEPRFLGHQTRVLATVLTELVRSGVHKIGLLPFGAVGHTVCLVLR